MFITHEAFKPKNICYKFFTKNLPGSNHRYFLHHEGHEQSNKILSEYFGSEKIAVVDQQHTNKVIITNDYNNYSVADGQVTNKSKVALAVVTADCVPILLADDEARVVGTVHAGWRGARANIMKEAVKQMRSLGANNITAIIGPCIKQHNYEVSEEFYKDFILESDAYKKFFIDSLKQNHYLFDLPGYVKDKLLSLDIQQILDVERDTYEEEDKFFSFRRTTHNPDSVMGNLASVIMLLD